MKKWLRQHLDKVIIIVGIIALGVLTSKVIQNLNDNLAAIRDAQFLNKVVIRKGDLTSWFSLKSGMNKPVFLNDFEDALVEFSAWSSHINADGTSLNLWEHDTNLRLDRENSRLFYSMVSAKMQTLPLKAYTIEEVVSLKEDGATVEYYFIPNEMISDVTFILGHYGWYFSEVKLGPEEITVQHSDLNKTQWENNEKPERMSTIKIKLLTKPKKKVVNRNVYGIYNFDVTYTLKDPKIFERNLLAKEEVILEKIEKLSY